ncbi:hypothetical protein ABT096_21465 [Streptomyces sp. NPDC002561]|uniref:hypothetical protein n=1 Tax=Streptomyces sp. NPDC002561 TaxID=3154418 RepID=UPI00332F5520
MGAGPPDRRRGAPPHPPEPNGGRIAAAEQFYLHASPERLRPGTTYHYGFDPADARAPGTLGTFTTAPARAGPFAFTAFGDQGISYHALGNDRLILGQNPAFHLHAGDIRYADPSGSGRPTDVYDARAWDQFLARTETVARTVPWMVTTGNHDMEAWYLTTNAHASDGGVRDAWVPLFGKHRVDLVINGHNHVYERTDAILGNAVRRPVPIGERLDPARDGIVYVTAGGAGKALYDFPVPDSHEGRVRDLESVDTYHVAKGGGKAAETVEWSRVRYTGFSFLAVEVTPGRHPRMKVTALAESGERIDHFEIGRGWPPAGRHPLRRPVRGADRPPRPVGRRRSAAGPRGPVPKAGVSGPWSRRCPGGRGPAAGRRRRSGAPTRSGGGYGGRGGRSSGPWWIDSLRSRGFRDRKIVKAISRSGFRGAGRGGGGRRRGCLHGARAQDRQSLVPARRSAPTKLGQPGRSVSTITRTSYYLRRRFAPDRPRSPRESPYGSRSSLVKGGEAADRGARARRVTPIARIPGRTPPGTQSYLSTHHVSNDCASHES